MSHLKYNKGASYIEMMRCPVCGISTTLENAHNMIPKDNCMSCCTLMHKIKDICLSDRVIDAVRAMKDLISDTPEL